MGFPDFHLHAVTVHATSRFVAPEEHVSVRSHELPAQFPKDSRNTVGHADVEAAQPANPRCLKSLRDVSAAPSPPSPFPHEHDTCVVQQEGAQSHQSKPQSPTKEQGFRVPQYVVRWASVVFGKLPLRKTSHLPNERARSQSLLHMPFDRSPCRIWLLTLNSPMNPSQ